MERSSRRRNLHPIAELSAENCTEQMGVPGPGTNGCRTSAWGSLPAPAKELQSEYFVPSEAVDAILAVERLRDQVTPHLLISEIRTIAADDLWMSTCYQRPASPSTSPGSRTGPRSRRLLPVIEKELAPFDVRPHRESFYSFACAVEGSLPRNCATFVELARKYDPQGKFQNEFLNRNIFGA